jgi:integrase
VQVGQFLEFVAERDDIPTGLIEVMADTGARAGEIAGLRWSNVDLHGGTLTITGQIASDPVDSKLLTDRSTKRPRSKSTLGLHPATVSALSRRQTEQKHRLVMGTGRPNDGVAVNLLFTWPDGSPIHPKTLSRIIVRLSVSAGLPRLTAHGLRHSFATAALAARVPVEVGSSAGQHATHDSGGLPTRDPGRRRRRCPSRRGPLPDVSRSMITLACDHAVIIGADVGDAQTLNPSDLRLLSRAAGI